MAPTGVSEFTFGFAFLHEQVTQQWAEVQAVPVLPSLVEEGRLGWDAHLPLRGTDFYYQFKVADYLHRSNALYRQKGTYQGPYFRIPLHRRKCSRQHRLLRKHSENHPNTYYVAPQFSLDVLSDHFLAGVVGDHSRIIPVADCQDIDDNDQHYITYAAGSTAWAFHSRPVWRKSSLTGSDLEDLYLSTRESWVPIDEEFGRQLFESTRRRVLELGKDTRVSKSRLDLAEAEPEKPKRATYLKAAAKLLTAFFGLTLVLVGEPPSDRQDGEAPVDGSLRS